jgi:hypothetical protein
VDCASEGDGARINADTTAKVALADVMFASFLRFIFAAVAVKVNKCWPIWTVVGVLESLWINVQFLGLQEFGHIASFLFVERRVRWPGN